LVAKAVAAESHDRYSLLATSSADRDGGRGEANDSDDGPTLVGVGVPRSQFASWVHYYLTHMTPDGEVVATVARMSTMEVSSSSSTTMRKTDSTREERAQVLDGILRHVETEEVDWEEVEENENEEDEEEKGDALSEVDGGGNCGGARPTASPTRRRREMREAIRRFWREGRLICESTSLLSGGRRRRSRSRSRSRSDDNGGRDNNVATDNDDDDGEGGEASSRAREEEEEGEEDAVEEERRYKLGRFTDALRSYADRLSCIVEDELHDVDDDDDDRDAAFSDDRSRRPSLLPIQSHPSSSSLTSASSANAAAAAAATVVSTDGDSQWQWRERGEASSASSPKWSMSNGGLRRFIEREYGSENARLLMARTLLRKSEDEQLKVRVLLPSSLVRRRGVSSL
jgi:hypothetical protein